MKLLLISFAVMMMAGCNLKKEKEPTPNKRPETTFVGMDVRPFDSTAIKAKQFSLDSTCMIRGHAFDAVDRIRASSSGGWIIISDPPQRVIDSPDSSYVVEDAGFNKFCDRCGKDIYFPKDKYIKTIWRKKTMVVSYGEYIGHDVYRPNPPKPR